MEIQKEEVKKVEEICVMAIKRDERLKRREKRKLRKHVLSEILNGLIIFIIWAIAMMVVVPISEKAPVEALWFYEFATAGAVAIIAAYWLDKLRRKK